MAKSQARSQAPRATSKRATEIDDVEVVEEAPGMSWESGVAIITAVMLLIAILLVDYQMGRDYAAGVFFK